MGLPYWLEKGLQRSCDWVYANLPQSLPSIQQLEKCKIISHRGEHDNTHVYENTLPAFERVLGQGIWGIEFDIRWTHDLVPVVFHDSDCRRLFHSETSINAITAKELKAAFPQIPLLEEVVHRFGRKLHFMVEIKKEKYSDPDCQNRILQQLFAGLEPKTDYHFLSLNPEMFQFVRFVESDTFLPVAELNGKEMSKLAHRRAFGGITGHYLLLGDAIVDAHHHQGQHVGTGFISSKNCLCRELNRGVDWIFTNNAIELQKIYNGLLGEINDS